MVVLGDFNCDVNETLHESLRKSGFVNTVEHMGDGLQPTMDTAGKRGRRAIDHIYVSPSLQDRVQKAWLVKEPGFRQAADPRKPDAWDHSDHLPVLMEMKM